MSLGEKIRAQYLEARGLTESDLAAMAPDERKAIEDEIKNAIMAALEVLARTTLAGGRDPVPKRKRFCVYNPPPPECCVGHLSLQTELAVNATPFIRPNQTLVGKADGVKGAVEPRLPKVQELVHFGEVRGQVIILPDKCLEHGLEIRNPIKDVGSGEAIAIKLAFEIG